MAKQEKAYTKNFHKFAKEVTKGIYNKPKIESMFSLEEANEYTGKYSTSATINLDDLEWFPKVAEQSVQYDLSPFCSQDISKTLQMKTQDSAPCDDELLYGFLSKLPSTFSHTVHTHSR